MKSELSPIDRRRITDLCDRIGMPHESSGARNSAGFAWSGEALDIAHHSGQGTSDFVHEIAHWLISPLGARGYSDFGLADADYDHATSEEELASLLGILIERSLDMDWKYTWEFHQWPTYGWEVMRDVRRVAKKLRARGLLAGLRPTCLR